MTTAPRKPRAMPQARQLLPLKEKAIENSILSWLALNRILAFKIDSVGTFDMKRMKFRKKHSVHHRVGIADILGCYGGRLLAIEVKSARGYPSAEQKAFLEDVRAAGGIAFIARSIDDVIENLAKERALDSGLPLLTNR